MQPEKISSKSSTKYTGPCGGERMKCLECGHELEVMHEEMLEHHPSDGYNFEYIHKECIGHCKNCLCDWIWEETWEFGDYMMTIPKRKFWG